MAFVTPRSRTKEEDKLFCDGQNQEREYQEIMKRKEKEMEKEYLENLGNSISKWTKRIVFGSMLSIITLTIGNELRLNYLEKHNPEKYEMIQERKRINYENYLEEKKQDSIYQTKADSLKRVFENKLEKEVK